MAALRLPCFSWKPGVLAAKKKRLQTLLTHVAKALKVKASVSGGAMTLVNDAKVEATLAVGDMPIDKDAAPKVVAALVRLLAQAIARGVLASEGVMAWLQQVVSPVAAPVAGVAPLALATDTRKGSIASAVAERVAVGWTAAAMLAHIDDDDAGLPARTTAHVVYKLLALMEDMTEADLPGYIKAMFPSQSAQGYAASVALAPSSAAAAADAAPSAGAAAPTGGAAVAGKKRKKGGDRQYAWLRWWWRWWCLGG